MTSDATASAGAQAPVLLTRNGNVATVTLNRPRVRNALNVASWQALRDGAQQLGDDRSVSVIVLTGTGQQAFSAGADIAEFPKERLERRAAARYGALVEATLETWEALPQPVIASIRGYCLGAGLELALTADFRLAAADAVVGIPATKRGFGVSVGDVRRLSAVIGAARARALLLTGESFQAEAAQALGLLDGVVPPEALDRRLQTLVTTLLGNAPLVMAWVKRVTTSLAANSLNSPTLPDEQVGAHIFATKDCAEGVAAFLERRVARFQGE